MTLAGLELANPIIAASGTFGYGIEFEEIVHLERIGGLVTKGISMEPMAGHAAPRIIQTAAGKADAALVAASGVNGAWNQRRQCRPVSSVQRQILYLLRLGAGAQCGCGFVQLRSHAGDIDLLRYAANREGNIQGSRAADALLDAVKDCLLKAGCKAGNTISSDGRFGDRISAA